MRWFFSAAAALLVIGFATPAQAQRAFALDLRGGATLPTEDLGSTELDRGLGFGLTASARVLQHAMLYAGWSWSGFDATETFPGAESRIEDTGYAAGILFQHPLARSIEGWVRAGALYNHIEIEDEDGALLADSGHEPGWEAGGGLFIPIGNRLALTPGVRYRTYAADLDTGTEAIDVDLSYVALDIGLTYSFGGRVLRTAAR